MGTIAAILFGVGVAGSTVLSVALVCIIGSYHQNKKRAALQVQRKSRLAYWDTYWADRALLGRSPCTASREKLTSGNEYAREINVTSEFAELEKHKIIAEHNK